MSNVLTQTIVYLLLLFIGYGFKRAGVFKVEDSNFLKSVILYITMPAAAVNGLKDLVSIPWLQSHSIRYREPSIPNDRAT
ncbi:hypothetical protein H6B11_10660 [Mediterraneibacter glycyrrhizinilyticus]|nr:hypothetical protein [Mediterraneibacter glycyrrhizinilyticus]MBM6854611.1 hypothetical protein [Mediterraneibacter glycyrrhizinilyticus]